VYLGMKLQPDLLKKNGIHTGALGAARRSGWTRTRLFRLHRVLRSEWTWATADFCVVQLGANDLQKHCDP